MVLNFLDRRLSHSHSLSPSYNLNSQQLEQDQLLNSFVDEASNWKNFSAMMAGGLAYRLGKIGILGAACRTPALANVLAPTIALFGEVITFRGVNHLLDTESGKNDPIQIFSSKELFADYFNFATLKFFGNFGKNHNLLYQHIIQDSAMVAGHQLTYALHLSTAPQGTLAQQIIHAANTNLAMSAGMSLGHFVTGGKVFSFEKSLELSSQSFTKKSVGLFHLLKQSEKFPLYFSEHSRSSDEVLRSWLPRFRQRYDQDDYRREIIVNASDIAFDRPEHLDHLLEAFSKKANAGTVDQLYLTRSIERLFRMSPLKSTTGSIENVFLHHLLREALGDHEHLRDRRLAKVLKVMEAGSQPRDVLNLIDEFGYSEFYDLPKEGDAYFVRSPETFIQDAEKWDQYYSRPEQRVLYHFIERASQGNLKVAKKIGDIFIETAKSGRYPEREIHRVLLYAAYHPLGFLILQRIFNVFAVQDGVWKLYEIGREDSNSDGIQTLQGTLESGASPDLLAHLINESRITAYIKDERLARKIVSIMAEVTPMIHHPEKIRAARERVINRIWDILELEVPISIHHLIRIMEANPSEQVEAFKKAVAEERFEIRILPEHEFTSLKDSFSLPEETAHSFFILNPSGPKDLIILKALPNYDLSESSGKLRAAHDITVRIIALIHEWEHWRHSSGHYDGIETGSTPLNISTFHRHDRIVSEIMSGLEEERWRNLNFDIETWRMAAMLGDNPVMYFRNLADESYYARRNQRILNEIFEP